MDLTLNSTVVGSDDSEFSLDDVVIDPLSGTVTHVVLIPAQGDHAPRLVPVGDLDVSTDPPQVSFGMAALAELPTVQEWDYVRFGEFPVAAPGWATGIEHVYGSAYYGADFASGWYDDHYTLGWHRIPAGEVEIRRRSLVRDTDGRELGTVDGFVCDDEHHVTHLVLEHGRFFGHRDITIPMSQVASIDNDEVQLDMTEDDVRKLPSVVVHPWSHKRRDKEKSPDDAT
jgi:sporulation protein YlmC with PRC-barrel domain